MADNTTLDAGTGGDVIRTDALLDESTGLSTVKVQAVKIITGRDGIDGGFVCRENPLAVSDAAVVKRLDILITHLETIIELLERG